MKIGKIQETLNSGRGSRGSRGEGCKQLISTYMKEKREKKQKLDIAPNETWEIMTKNQQDE